MLLLRLLTKPRDDSAKLLSSSQHRPRIKAMHQSAQQEEGACQDQLVIDAHSHSPQDLGGPEGGLETQGPEGFKSGAAAMPSSGGGIAVRGGAGHVRVWAQWEAGGLTRGCMYGLAAIYQTRSSVKPTILLFAQAQVVVCACPHFALAHSLGDSSPPRSSLSAASKQHGLYMCAIIASSIYIPSPCVRHEHVAEVEGA